MNSFSGDVGNWTYVREIDPDEGKLVMSWWGWVKGKTLDEVLIPIKATTGPSVLFEWEYKHIQIAGVPIHSNLGVVYGRKGERFSINFYDQDLGPDLILIIIRDIDETDCSLERLVNMMGIYEYCITDSGEVSSKPTEQPVPKTQTKTQQPKRQHEQLIYQPKESSQSRKTQAPKQYSEYSSTVKRHSNGGCLGIAVGIGIAAFIPVASVIGLVIGD